MRIYSLLAVVLLGTVQGLKQIRIGVPRNARSFIQQQSEETNPSNDRLNEPNPSKRDVIFEHYPTLIPSPDQATQIYEETSSIDSFEVKRLFTTPIHEPSKIVIDESDKEESPKTDQKTSRKLLLSGGTAEDETKIKNSHEDKFKEIKGGKTKNGFLIYQYREEQLHKKKETPKIFIDRYHENFLGRKHVIKQKNEEIDEMSVKAEETTNLAEVTKFIDDLETLQNSSFVTSDDEESEFSMPKSLTSSVNQIPRISKQLEEQKLNDLDSKTTVLPKSTAELKLEPSTTKKPLRKKAKKIRDSQNLYPVDKFQEQGFSNDKRTTVSSVKIPKSPKFGKRFKLDDPEDEKPEELLIFRRAQERNTSFKTAAVDEPALKVLGSKTFVDGSTFSNSKEGSEKDLEKAEIPRKSHQFRKRTIAPYKSQIKQYFVTTPPKEVIEMPAIVDKETQMGYTGRQLVQMCDETKHMGHSWGINDISDFAQKNCPLIRLYYPNLCIVKDCEMAFYWQTQQVPQQNEPQQASPWDSINLGGTTDNCYQQGYSNWSQQQPQQNIWTQQAQVNGNPSQDGNQLVNNSQQQQGYNNSFNQPYPQQPQQLQQPQQPQTGQHYGNQDGYSYHQQDQQFAPQHHTPSIEHAPILPKKVVAEAKEFTASPAPQSHAYHESSADSNHFHHQSNPNPQDSLVNQFSQHAANQHADQYQQPSFDQYQQPSFDQYRQSSIDSTNSYPQTAFPPVAQPIAEPIFAQQVENWNHESQVEHEQQKEVTPQENNWDSWGNQQHETQNEHHQQQATIDMMGTSQMGNQWDNWGEHESTPEENSQLTTQSEPLAEHFSSEVSREATEEPAHQEHEGSTEPLIAKSSSSKDSSLTPAVDEKPEISIPQNPKIEFEENEPEQKPPTPAPQMETPVPEIKIPNLEELQPPLESKILASIKQEPMTPISSSSNEPGKPLAESTPTTKEEEIATAALDINVPSPSDTPVKKDLQTQLSDTQNSDRTSDGFVKIQAFNQDLETEYSATNSLFGWNTSQPTTRTLNTSGRFTADDYREQEANDSAASSILTRTQISNQYLEYKKRIPQIVSRQSMLRGPNANTGQTGRPNPLFEEGRRSVLNRLNNSSSRPASAHYEMGLHQNRSMQGHDGNTSVLTNPDVPLDYSFESPQTAYGESFVENSRRSRMFRQVQNVYRPQQQQQRYPIDPNAPRHSRQSNYGYNNQSAGRRSVAGYGDLQGGEQQRRRPQSSYDTRAMARMERSGMGLDQYDVFNSPGVSSESADGADSEMDAEMAQYNAHAQMAQQHLTQIEIYLIGTLKVPLAKFVATIRKFPPPQQYYQLRPIERVAFVFYTALWQRHYLDVEGFHKKFNREFYTLTASGASDDDALYEICAQMQTRFTQLNKERYTNTQKQLFSDERDSHDEEERMYLPDRHSDDDDQSERDYGERADEASDNGSLELQQRGPLKFTAPKTFTVFGPNGKLLIIDPKNFGPTTVKLMSISTILHDDQSRRLFESIQMFRGPLTAQTPSHQVTLYIERQINRLERSDVAQECPSDNDVQDCRLLWQLLRVVVQQHGKVTGPDIARLLLAAAPETVTKRERLLATHRERSTTPTVRGPDPRIKDAFNDFLLRGHVEEAIDLALQYEMYAEALVLARRVDNTKLAQIEERYINSMLQNNPVTTLLTVAADQRAPILINPPTDDGGSWRAHAAIVLANLNTSWAMEYNAAADFCFLAVSLLTGHDVFRPVAQAVKTDKPIRQHISLINASLPDDAYNSTDCKYGFSLTDLHATEIFAYGVSLARETSPLSTSLDFQMNRIKYARLLAEMGFPKNAFKYGTDVAQQIWPYYSMVPLQSLFELCDIADQTFMASETSMEAGVWIGQLRQQAAQIIPQQHTEQIAQPIPQMGQQAAPATNSAPPQPSVQQGHPIDNYHQPPVPQPPALQPPVPQPSVPQPPALQPPVPQPPIPQPPQQTNASSHEDLNSSFVYQPLQSAENPQELYSPVRSRINSISSQAADWHNQQDPISMHAGVDRRASVSSQVSNGRPKQHFSESPERQNQWDQQYQQPSPPSPLAAVPEMIMPQVPQVPVQQVMQPRVEPQPSRPQPQLQPQHQPMSVPQHSPAPVQQQLYEQPRQTPKIEEKPPTGTLKKSPSRSSGGFIQKIAQFVQSKTSSEAKLPDDSNPKIRYDPVLNQWVGDGVEEEVAPAPPPMMSAMAPAPAQPSANPLAAAAPQMAAPSSPPAPAPTTGLRGARAGGAASRYRTVGGIGGATSPSGASSMTAPLAPQMPMPTQAFNFIPQMPESEESVDPFSAAPAEPVDGQPHQ
ncbi:unnamed protein product, partial [Mesorhabditis belari]|uniref:Protein transport protein sec16 n=1 Tax=Mesorhabditis belari TaxID=2138241 RepID=A0AAF3F0I8_9BILA